MQHMSERYVVYHFQDERSRVKVTRVIQNVCRVRPVASSLFDRITSQVAYVQRTRGRCVAMCHAPFSGRKVRGQGHMDDLNFLLCSPRGFLLALFDLVTSYVACIQHTRGPCVLHHFQEESSKVKVTRVFFKYWPAPLRSVVLI